MQTVQQLVAINILKQDGLKANKTFKAIFSQRRFLFTGWVFIITEKAPTRAPTRAFTFKTLLRHYVNGR